jgi:hypothetical protein
MLEENYNDVPLRIVIEENSNEKEKLLNPKAIL